LPQRAAHYEYARDVTRRLMRTKAFLKSRDERKRVEMRFAHLKIHHGFERNITEFIVVNERRLLAEQHSRDARRRRNVSCAAELR
jgi:hypothetical protein